ncbi:MAG: CoB--CoM heterodisulfide reductase iron-sulfur subunit B family protein [Candidatus Omnitrophota bacterium]|nr:CoB--CoM heterodisulfide reductase iron-sulfur subunit B family protein [Candidatus Omnitrophota bacterium]
MKFAYYPGCSLHGTAKEYDLSLRAVCRALDIDLEEVPDWNCCGASSAHSLDNKLAISLCARNLKIIEQQNLDVVIPCAACFSRAKISSHTLKNNTALRSKIENEMGFNFKLQTKIYHLIELIVNEVGLDKVRAHIKRYLTDLRLVCYYGCLLVRPHDITELDDKEDPQLLDILMSATGAAAIDWPYKTECCGASLSLSKSEVVVELVGRMVSWAKEAGAQAIVTACPLCQANLEMRQQGRGKIPIFYFTELLGLAFGLKEAEGCLKKHIVNTDKLVKSLI